MSATAESRGSVIVNRRWLLSLAVGAVSLIWLAWAASAARPVVLPVVVVLNVAAVAWIVLWNRDGAMPLFDIGAVCLVATLLYSIVPPIQFILSGLVHTPLSAIQLYDLDPGPREFGAFTWRYVVYFVSFAAVYVHARKASATAAPRIEPLDQAGTYVIVSLYLAFTAILYFIKIYSGVGFDVVYDPDVMAAAVGEYEQLPLLLRQVYNSVYGMEIILKFGVMTLLFVHWGNRRCRMVIVLWLCAAILGYILRMGARTELVLTLLCAAMLYHRFVRRLTLFPALAAGVSLIALFLVFGAVRGTASLGGNIELAHALLDYNKDALFSIGTEFQTLFGGAYDLHHLIGTGVVNNVPWQFWMHDLLIVIPQQLLPFDKIDVQGWYVQLHGDRMAGYFMFNPIAQASVGMGWVELALRGGLTAYILAQIHGWYVRRGRNFWVFLLYLWLTLEVYYTIRSSTSTIFAFVLFRFVPLYVLTTFCLSIVKGFRAGGDALGASGARSRD